MRLYITGPEGPEQLATKWLLRERGYTVVCATDVRMPTYEHNQGLHPTAQEFARRQMLEMHYADAVVLQPDEMDAGEVLRVLHTCRFAGLRAVLYEELPMQCPSELRAEEILDELDIAHQPPRVPMGKRLRQQVSSALRRMDGWARRFDERWAWFFTNGNKAHRLQHTPGPYPTTHPPPTSTA